MIYRKEIDGLRAIAVLSVILFHAGFNTFSGGFIGVDVFFVISGYLITTIIINDINNGTFSIRKFYERRTRRILPALFFMIVTILPLAWLLMIPEQLVDFAKSLIAVPIFISNILFLLQSGYFSPSAELLPLLHTWSLAVEEQYYVVFPVFLVLSWKLGKRNLIWLVAIIAITSILLAQWGTLSHQFFNFYMLPTRSFELLIGALISLFLVNKNDLNILNEKTSSLASILGIVLIAYATLAFDKNTPSPSFYTLIPTVGAGLIILFSNSNNMVGSLLGNKILVGIGLISYSTYLWHQPLLSFARLASINELTIIHSLTACVSSIAIGFVSWKFIETPFRKDGFIGEKKLYLCVLTAAATLISVGLFTITKNGFPERGIIPPQVLNSIVAPKVKDKVCSILKKTPEINIENCYLGDKRIETPSLAIIGDSHSLAISPVFEEIGLDYSKKFVQIGLAGCPPIIGTSVSRGVFKEDVCKTLANEQYEYIKNNHIKHVFLVANWSKYTNGDYDGGGIYFLTTKESQALTKENSRINFERYLDSTVRKYRALDANVYVLYQIPQQKVNASYLYKKIYFFDLKNKKNLIAFASISKREHLQLQSFNRDYFQGLQSEKGLRVINLDEFFCDNSICHIGNETSSLYSDTDHLSNQGAKSLYFHFLKEFKNVIGQPLTSAPSLGQ